jgi:hypothetical protein
MPATTVTLTLLYCALLTALILRLKFFRNYGIAPTGIAALFLVKVSVGLLYAFLYLRFYGGGDTMQLFRSSRLINAVFSGGDYALFFRLVFGINGQPPGDDIRAYANALSFWNESGAYFVMRFHALASLLSFGHYYVHVVFYNWITLIGLLSLYRFLTELCSGAKKFFLVAVFLFPSILFWSSGIHKDGFALAALGLILFHALRLFAPAASPPGINQSTVWRQRITWINVLGLIAGAGLLYVLRNFWLLLLIPSLVSLLVALHFPKFQLLKFLLIHVIYFLFAIETHWLNPGLGFLALIAQKQAEFFSIAGGSDQVFIPRLSPTLTSLFPAIPFALFNCFFEPIWWQVKNIFQLMVSLENLLVLIVMLLTMACRKKSLSAQEKSLLLFSLFFSLALYLVIGLTVPVAGALVRYKIGALLFMLTAASLLFDWKRMTVIWRKPSQ